MRQDEKSETLEPKLAELVAAPASTFVLEAPQADKVTDAPSSTCIGPTTNTPSGAASHSSAPLTERDAPVQKNPVEPDESQFSSARQPLSDEGNRGSIDALPETEPASPRTPTISDGPQKFPSSYSVWNGAKKGVLTGRGHINLAIRGGVSMVHALLSLSLYFVPGTDLPVYVIVSVCEFLEGITLFIQCRSIDPLMFLLRSVPNFCRGFFFAYAAQCGRRGVFGECDAGGWQDERFPVRLLHSIGAARYFMIGLSLILQYLLPFRGVGKFGNEQLFYRGFVHFVGMPLNLLLGIMKITELSTTIFAASIWEVVVDFLRAWILNTVSTWALWNQWATTGSGLVTDDSRTSMVGTKHKDAPTSFFGAIEKHKGHRNLLIRGIVAYFQALMTFFLIVYDIDLAHKVPIMLCQLTSGCSLVTQWRTGDPRMFLVRGTASYVRSVAVFHAAACGREMWFEDCNTEAWGDVRRPFRIVHILGAVRLVLNGLSLWCQYLFPHRMFRGHGNEQLFYRGVIQGTGTGINICRAIMNRTLIVDTEFERNALEVMVNLTRACVLIPIASWSLIDQWYYTGAGNAGHKNLTKHEEKVRASMELRRSSRISHEVVSAS
jgi:hypothetical protein